MSWSDCQRCLSPITGKELQFFLPIETNIFPFSLFFLNWNQGWRDDLWVLSLQWVNFFHSLLPTSSWPGSRPLPQLGKRSGASLGRVTVQPRGGPEEGVTWWQQVQRKPSYDVSPPSHSALPMQEELSEEWSFVKNPWKVPEQGWLFPRCKVELSSWLAVGKQSCLSLSKSSHPISSP